MFNQIFPLLSDPTPLNLDDCLESILCTEEQVADLLYSLDITKSTGLDGVSAIMLKSTATAVASRLTKLSIATRMFAPDWKCARLTPTFKSSDSSIPKNYRPISILSMHCEQTS